MKRILDLMQAGLKHVGFLQACSKQACSKQAGSMQAGSKQAGSKQAGSKHVGLLHAGAVLGCLLLFAACSTTEERDPSEVAAGYATRAEALLEEGKVEEAYDLAQAALKVDPQSLRALLIKADCLVKLEQPEQALILLTAPTDELERRAVCLNRAGMIALKMNQPSVAVMYLNQAIEVTPNNAILYVNRGTAEAAGGREIAAAESFKKALEMEGDRKEIVPYLAQALEVMERFQEAETVMEKELPREQYTAKDLLLLGSLKCRQGRLEEGLAVFREAEAKEGDLPAVHYNIGHALEEMGDLEAAKGAYRKAIDLDPDYPPAAFHLGCLYFMEGRHDDGLALIDKAVAAEQDLLLKRALEGTRNRMMQEAGLAVEPENGDEDSKKEIAPPGGEGSGEGSGKDPGGIREGYP